MLNPFDKKGTFKNYPCSNLLTKGLPKKSEFIFNLMVIEKNSFSLSVICHNTKNLLDDA